MSRADYYDELYRECIPHRITPAPSLHLGPTEQWRLEELLTAVGDDETPLEGLEAAS